MKPTAAEIISTLKHVGELLGVERVAYCFEGRFRFELEGGYSLLISADDAGRFRLTACYRSRPGVSMWCLAGDGDRLKVLVLAARDQVAALTA